MRGRPAVLLLVAGMLALVAIGAVLSSGDRGPGAIGSGSVVGGASNDAPGGEPADPVTSLNAALADGRPAYVLIHSLT